MSTTTRVVVNSTRYETLVYEFEGVVEEEEAYELIESAEHDPVDSDIHSEDLDIVGLEVSHDPAG